MKAEVGTPITVRNDDGSFEEGWLSARVEGLYWWWTSGVTERLVLGGHRDRYWAVGTGPDIRAQLRLAGSAP